MQPVSIARSRIENAGVLDSARTQPEVRPLRIGAIELSGREGSATRSVRIQLEKAPFPVTLLRIGLTDQQPAQLGHGSLPTFDQSIAAGPLDGLIVTDDSSDHHSFLRKRWWGELSEILWYARAFVPSTLGLSTGGLILAKMLGLEPTPLPRRLFGLFPLLSLDLERAPVSGGGNVFFAPQDRMFGIDAEALKQAEREGRVSLLAFSREAGYSIFESEDRRYVAHLGLPAADPDVLRLAGTARSERGSIPSVEQSPWNVEVPRLRALARAHRDSFFSDWLTLVRDPTRLSRDTRPPAAGAARRTG